jgi:hypothetical protein
MLNLCGIVAAILKMATGRKFSTSGIILGHYVTIRGAILRFQNFEMSAIFKMATKIRYKKWAVKIQHCPIS